MAASAEAHGGRHATTRDDGKTPAQWYCYLAGAALLLAGIVGFFVDSGFDTGDPLNGDKLILFEVNGWHNIVHILSGLVLLAAAPKRVSAKAVALGFGIVYGIVTLWGLIDGDTVLGLIPVNPADNVLHLALALAGIVAALASSADDRNARESTATGRDTVGTEAGGGRLTGRTRGDVDTLTGTQRTER